MIPAPMTAATAAPAAPTSSNAASATCASLRLRRELDRDLGDDRQQPLGAMDQREQVVAGAVERVAAELDDLAGDEHAAHAPDVVDGQPVLETVHAARVLRDIAADRCRRSATTGPARNRDRRAQPPRISQDCARPAARRRCCASGSIATMLRNFAIATAERRACPAVRRPTGSSPRRARRRAPARHDSACRISTTCISFSGIATAAGSSRYIVRPSHSYGFVSSAVVSSDDAGRTEASCA